MIRWGVVLLAVGCKHPTPSPVLDHVTVRYRQIIPSSLPHPDESALLTLAKSAIAAAPGTLAYVETADPKAPRASLAVEVELSWGDDPSGARALRSVVHAKLSPKDDGGPLVLVDREGLVEKEDLKSDPKLAEVAAHLRRSFELVVTGAMKGEQLWLGPPESARAALTGSDADLRDEAIRIAGERHDRAAVAALLPLLKSEDVELRDRTIGALAEIGDPKTVKPIAELAKFGDLDELPKILDAVARVGGPEAIAYLEFVASAHSIPEIRDEAKQALEHLRARTK